ncbi:MAG: flavodoxin family protein [Oscillospiraceae bacterium]|nr:flavodoxin family protein [Oscillospiraceae bacterium]
MKVILVNGSPHEFGCTEMALRECAAVLEQQGISTKIFWIGTKPISGCIGCGACKKGLGKCCIDDAVNQFTALAEEADGFIFGSPVHYAAISGSMSAFMDRVFYSGGSKLAGKPAAGVVSCRRGGASAAFDEFNKYFTINSMPVVSSQYWNQVHGSTPEQVLEDHEGIQTLRMLSKNMAWLLKCIEAGKAAGINRPEQEKIIRTNFIR